MMNHFVDIFTLFEKHVNADIRETAANFRKDSSQKKS
jgi:hypothetical protein